MARHEMKKHEMSKMHERAKGGEVPEDEAEKKDIMKRKRGGRVHGKKSEHRPDRRARGGSTSDMSPLTSAGKMSTPAYENKTAKNSEDSGAGSDKD